jgi:Domain of unknown function (DUF4259)
MDPLVLVLNGRDFVGTWGPGPFDNDSATEWCAELEERAPDERAAFIADTLTRTAGVTGYLDVDDGQRTVAAVAVLVRQLPTGRSPTMVDAPEFVSDHYVAVDQDLRALAVRALERVMSKPSELPELWGDDEIYAAIIAQLHRALAS